MIQKLTLGHDGFTLLEMVMVLVVIGLLVAIIVPKLHRISGEAAEIAIIKTLEGMAAAMETYAKDNNGQYPPSMETLITATPSYLSRNPCGFFEQGYMYTCVLSLAGYNISASPISGGGGTWRITTGGDLRQE